MPDFAAAAAHPAFPRTVVACSDEDLAILDSPSRRAFHRVLRRLEAGGSTIRRFQLPEAVTTISAYYVLACAEASSNLARFDGMRYGSRLDGDGTLAAAIHASRTAGFGDEVRLRILLGTTVLSQGYRDAIYAAATAARKAIRERLLGHFEQGEFLLIPVARTAPRRLSDPVEAGEDYDGDRFTILASLAGLPALAVPAGNRGRPALRRRADGASLGGGGAAFGGRCPGRLAIPDSGARRSTSPSRGAATVRRLRQRAPAGFPRPPR